MTLALALGVLLAPAAAYAQGESVQAPRHPGHPNHFAITATQTGTFTGHCSELCGLLPQPDAV